LGKAVERVRGVWRPRLRFLRNRSRAQAARGWAAMVETSSPSRRGCCRSSGRRQRPEAGARIPCVGGRCRNVARAITTHRFGLWAVDGASVHYFVKFGAWGRVEGPQKSRGRVPDHTSGTITRRVRSSHVFCVG
jgi:hypothetical protein